MTSKVQLKHNFFLIYSCKTEASNQPMSLLGADNDTPCCQVEKALD